MKKYTVEQYVYLSERFNKLSFYKRIETIQKNTDILTLASDGNWWGVQAKDKDIQEQLEDGENEFRIEKEWGANEMSDLIQLLGIDNTSM